MIIVAESAVAAEARRVYAEAGGLSPSAVEALAIAIAADPDLVREAARMAADAALREINREVRSALSSQAQGRPKVFSKEFQDSVVRTIGGLNMLGWPMMDGSPLGKASYEHVAREGSRYKANARGNLKRAIFMEKVLSRMAPNQFVEDVFDNATLGGFIVQADREARASLQS